MIISISKYTFKVMSWLLCAATIISGQPRSVPDYLEFMDQHGLRKGWEEIVSGVGTTRIRLVLSLTQLCNSGSNAVHPVAVQGSWQLLHMWYGTTPDICHTQPTEYNRDSCKMTNRRRCLHWVMHICMRAYFLNIYWIGTSCCRKQETWLPVQNSPFDTPICSILNLQMFFPMKFYC